MIVKNDCQNRWIVCSTGGDPSLPRSVRNWGNVETVARLQQEAPSVHTVPSPACSLLPATQTGHNGAEAGQSGMLALAALVIVSVENWRSAESLDTRYPAQHCVVRPAPCSMSWICSQWKFQSSNDTFHLEANFFVSIPPNDW